MQIPSTIRRVEPYFLGGIAAIYAVRRLFEEVNRIDDMVSTAQEAGAPSATIWRHLANYNHTLNNNIPFLLGLGLFLAAWYVFHQLAYPQLQQRTDDRRAWLLLSAVGALLLISVFVYHYLKLHVRYQHNQADQIIGLKVYSMFRLRTVLADTIGLAIMLGAYELVFQYYQFLTSRMDWGSEPHFRLVSYMLLGGIAVLSFSLNGYLPATLWHGEISKVLLVLGFMIQIVLLQQYVYTYVLPLLKDAQQRAVVLLSNIGMLLLTIILANTILWGAASNFYFRPGNPIIGFVVIVLIGSVSVAYLRQVLSKEKTFLQAQVSTGAAELASLRAQINPHFLFNALNSLYATALKEKGEKTADGIQKLGDMMRFMLEENNRDRIPLDKEIEYLRNYIEIQRMRIDETHPIEIRVTIQEPDRPIYLAPMLLTPFVENAFKHGISLRHPSWIYITLTLDGTRLYFKVHNSRHKKTQNDPEEHRSGVGLANVQKRLQLIYPDRHQLTIQESEQDYFIALTLLYW